MNDISLIRKHGYLELGQMSMFITRYLCEISNCMVGVTFCIGRDQIVTCYNLVQYCLGFEFGSEV